MVAPAEARPNRSTDDSTASVAVTMQSPAEAVLAAALSETSLRSPGHIFSRGGGLVPLRWAAASPAHSAQETGGISAIRSAADGGRALRLCLSNQGFFFSDSCIAASESNRPITEGYRPIKLELN